MDFETEQRVMELERLVSQLSERLSDVEAELRGAAEWAAEQKERNA